MIASVRLISASLPAGSHTSSSISARTISSTDPGRSELSKLSPQHTPMTTDANSPKHEHPAIGVLRQHADIDPESLSPGTARKLLELSFSRPQQERVALLSEKAQEGTLTPAEQEELDEYIRVGTLLSILQSKARRTLRR